MNFTKYFIAGKDYLLVPAESYPGCTLGSTADMLCDRAGGIGADGIFTFQQNNGKNIEISGLSSDGQIMRDFSSASICACFDIFSKTDATNLTFSFENQAFSELNCDFSGNNALISYRFHPATDNKKNRLHKQAHGNRKQNSYRYRRGAFGHTRCSFFAV